MSSLAILVAIVLPLAAAAVAYAWLRYRRVRETAAAATAELDHLATEAGGLRRERDRFIAALHAADVGILITDDAGLVTSCNEAASRYLGARHGEVVAEVRIREMIEEALRSRKAAGAELELYTPQRRVLRLRAEPLVWEDEELGVAAYIVDTTDEHRVDAMRRDFIANVSHELKTPLGAVVLLAETLSSNLGDPEVAARLTGRLEAETSRLSRLLEDMLDLSRAEAPTVPLDRVALADVVSEAVEPAQRQADAAGVRLIVDEVSPEALVRGDALQLRTLIANLLDNAVKYCDPEPGAAPPRVWLRVGIDGDRVLIEVEDEGIGISDTHTGRIFERFYRVDRARSRATGGTGLGLAIVRNAAAGHGGEVTVDSTLGEGSVFRVTLPLWREP